MRFVPRHSQATHTPECRRRIKLAMEAEGGVEGDRVKKAEKRLRPEDIPVPVDGDDGAHGASPRHAEPRAMEL